MIKKTIIFLLVILSAYAVFHLSHITYASIDKVYIVNLDRSVDRYAEMQKKLSNIELPVAYSRFTAVDGRKLNLINPSNGEAFTGEEIRNQKPILKGSFITDCVSNKEDEFLQITLNQSNYNNRLMGEIGCSCSHHKIWLDAVKHEYKNILVLEDDVKFIENFTDKLELYTNNAPKDYDLLYLNYGNLGKAYKNPTSNPYLRIVMNFFDQHVKNPFWKQGRKNIGSTQGYILSKKGAEKLLKCSQMLASEDFRSIDMEISACIERGDIIAYVSKPALVISDHSIKSDIGKWGENEE